MIINRGYYQRGFQSLFNRSPNMDALIATGSTAAFVYSLYATFMMAYYVGRGDMTSVHHYMMQLYYESTGMILTLISVGKYLESRSKQKTSEAIAKLMKLMPSTATVLKDGQEVEIAIDDVGSGYSNLNRIVYTAPKYLKIDMELIRDIHQYKEKRDMVKALVSYCQEVNCLLIAEGVETKQEYICLKDLGVELVQGFYFGKPQPDFL